MNKVCLIVSIFLIVIIGALFYFSSSTYTALRSTQTALDVEKKNSIERAIKVSAMQKTLEQYYPDIETDFNRHFFELYTQMCKIEAQKWGVPSALLCT